MDPQRYRRLRELLEEASVLGDAGRDSLVERTRRGDPDLARELEALLQACEVPTGELLPGGMPGLETTEGGDGRARAGVGPAPERLGPFRLHGVLGRGGMGVVHAATDVEGREVAVKVVHPGLLASRGSLDRFVREAQAGARVRHDNVVRTFSAGSVVEGGREHHYLVMERIEGRSLRELLDELGRLPDGLLREIAAQAAAGLAAIHAAGIVHRDIKPENLLITDDQRLRISDLGVAKIIEASASLTRDGQFLGTLLYAAPEQLEGRDVGPAADLYSLGVLLHELATGENPFSRDTPAAVLRAQLGVVPRPADEQNPDLSPFMAELIGTLLAKEPEARIPSARELLLVLRDAEGSSWWAAREVRRRVRSSELPRVPVRRPTRLFGREDQLERLRHAWRAAQAGDGGCVILEGEAGLGKSRVIDELLRSIAGEEAHVLYGSSPPAGGQRCLAQSLLSKFGATGLASALRSYLEGAEPLADALGAAVLQAGPAAAHDFGAEAVQVAAVRLLSALAAERPTLWIFEDLHFAPDAGWQLAGGLGRAAAGQRALVLLSVRAGWRERRSLLGEEELPHVVLDRLSDRDVRGMLDESLADPALAAQLAPRIAPRAEGVPFYVLELLRGLEESGALRRRSDGRLDRAGDVDAIAVPAALRELLVGRLAGLTPAERELLDAAAVEGHEFDADAIADVLDRRPIHVLQDLARIERQHGLVRPVGSRFRFDHHLVQEVVHDELPGALRREYHSLLGQRLQRSVDAPVDGPVARQLAHHLLRGARPEEALPHLEAAWSELASRWHHDEALELLDRALALESLGPECRVRLLLRRAATLNVLGRRDEERAAAETAAVLADQSGDAELRIRSRSTLGTLLWQVAEEADAAEILREARELARAEGDRQLELQVTGRLGIAIGRLGDTEGALELQRWCSRAAEDLDDAPARAKAEGNIGNMLCALSKFREAIPHFELALELAEGTADARLKATSVAGLGLGWWHVGEVERAEECHRRHLELCGRSGDLRGEGIALGNLAVIALFRGRLAEALRHHDEECRMFGEVGDRRHLVMAKTNAALAWVMLGAVDRAGPLLDEAWAEAVRLGSRRTQGHVRIRQAYMAECEGRLGPAEELARDAAESFADASDSENQASAVVFQGFLQLDAGRLQDAGGSFRRARALLEASAIPRSWLKAEVGLANLPGGDPGRASALLDRHGPSLGTIDRVEALYWAWRATDDRRHLEAARVLVEDLRRHAPPEHADTMVSAVPLYRDVLAACRRAAEGG